LTVKNARFHKRMVLVTTKEVTTMNDAELLRDKHIYIKAEDLPALEEDEFYVAD